ncbi:MAG: hypothetical protein DRP08_01845 [Candidatus Aenigmatarchaeota archaeon]|nr:MAG: hypothetical protein DRP08_01845 [Candidatus Aenigmarchaeota archaeon]
MTEKGPVIGKGYITEDGTLRVMSIFNGFSGFYEKIKEDVEKGKISIYGKTLAKTGTNYIFCTSGRIPFRLELSN